MWNDCSLLRVSSAIIVITLDHYDMEKSDFIRWPHHGANRLWASCSPDGRAAKMQCMRAS